MIFHLLPHPDNPRIVLRDDVIQGIANQLKETGVFQDKYALHERPIGEDGDGEIIYQILQGHTRIEAARRTGIETIPCWSEEMDDERAYMGLILGNQQDGMSPLEIGIHALGATKKYGRNGTGVKAYAESIGRATGDISRLVKAGEVFLSLEESFPRGKLLDKARHLYEVSTVPPDSWPALVAALVDNGWSVKECECQVTSLNDIVAAVPKWYPISMSDLTNLALTDEKTAKQ